MATVKKIPANDFVVEITLTSQEARQLTRLLGVHTSGNLLNDLYRELTDQGIRKSDECFYSHANGTISEKS